MNDLFDKTKKLSRKQSVELAGLCAGAALLLFAAAFISTGGVQGGVKNFFAANGVAPASQTAIDLNCPIFGSQCNGPFVYQYMFTPSNTTITLGQSVNLTWSIFGEKHSNFCASTQGAVCTITTYRRTPSCIDDPKTSQPISGVCTSNISGTGGTYTAAPTQTTTYYLCSDYLYPYAGCVPVTVTIICPAGYTGSPPNCVPPPPPPPPPVPTPTVTIDAGAGSGITKTVTAGTPVTITGTFTPGSGDTITHTSLVDFQLNALPGVSTNVPPTTKSYVFTPTAAGTYVFYPSVQTASYPAWNNYGKSVTVVATVAGPCNDIPAQTTVPNGCAVPSPAPGVCTPSGGSYSPGTNSCSCPAGQHLSGSACVANPPQPLCSNGLNNSYAPSCTCPSGQYQPLGGSSCVALPVCANGLSQSYSPSCMCPAGQVQVAGGSTCVLAGAINSLTANPSRVLKNNPVTVTWSTSGMSACSLSSFTAVGTSQLSTAKSSFVTPTILGKTVFTLNCSDASDASYSSSVTVNLIPITIEQ